MSSGLISIGFVIDEQLPGLCSNGIGGISSALEALNTLLALRTSQECKHPDELLMATIRRGMSAFGALLRRALPLESDDAPMSASASAEILQVLSSFLPHTLSMILPLVHHPNWKKTRKPCRSDDCKGVKDVKEVSPLDDILGQLASQVLIPLIRALEPLSRRFFSALFLGSPCAKKTSNIHTDQSKSSSRPKPGSGSDSDMGASRSQKTFGDNSDDVRPDVLALFVHLSVILDDFAKRAKAPAARVSNDHVKNILALECLRAIEKLSLLPVRYIHESSETETVQCEAEATAAAAATGNCREKESANPKSTSQSQFRPIAQSQLGSPSNQAQRLSGAAGTVAPTAITQRSRSCARSYPVRRLAGKRDGLEMEKERLERLVQKDTVWYLCSILHRVLELPATTPRPTDVVPLSSAPAPAPASSSPSSSAQQQHAQNSHSHTEAAADSTAIALQDAIFSTLSGLIRVLRAPSDLTGATCASSTTSISSSQISSLMTHRHHHTTGPRSNALPSPSSSSSSSPRFDPGRTSDPDSVVGGLAVPRYQEQETTFGVSVRGGCGDGETRGGSSRSRAHPSTSISASMGRRTGALGELERGMVLAAIERAWLGR